jgi:hypothetical protein
MPLANRHYCLIADCYDDPRPVVVRDETPDGETAYQARFYLDPHGLDLNGGNHTILRGELGADVGVLAQVNGARPRSGANRRCYSHPP